MVETHPEKRLIGYARVSTYGQTLDSQLEQLRAAGCSSRTIYREKVTGARADGRELNQMLGKLAPGTIQPAGPIGPPVREWAPGWGNRAALRKRLGNLAPRGNGAGFPRELSFSP